MATPTKKGLGKVPKPVWYIGGVAVVAGGYYWYKKKKEEGTTKPTTTAETAYSGEELRNQSFIPVVSTNQSGAGARYYPEYNPNAINNELYEHFKEMFETNTQSNKEQFESAEKLEKERTENENTLIQSLLSSFKESQTQNNERLKEQIDAAKALTGGGSPGTTTAGNNTTGGSPAPIVVSLTQAASAAIPNASKALFGGRTIVHPNEPDSYIVSAKGQHCPNTEWNRDHPREMRGCK